MTGLLNQWILSSLMGQTYSKMTTPGFIGLNEWFTEHETSFPQMDWSPQSPHVSPLENGCAREGFVQWSDSLIINTRFWWKINPLERKKSYDNAELFWNNVTVNICHNPSWRWPNNILRLWPNLPRQCILIYTWFISPMPIVSYLCQGRWWHQFQLLRHTKGFFSLPLLCIAPKEWPCGMMNVYQGLMHCLTIANMDFPLI